MEMKLSLEEEEADSLRRVCRRQLGPARMTSSLEIIMELLRGPRGRRQRNWGGGPTVHPPPDLPNEFSVQTDGALCGDPVGIPVSIAFSGGKKSSRSLPGGREGDYFLLEGRSIPWCLGLFRTGAGIRVKGISTLG